MEKFHFPRAINYEALRKAVPNVDKIEAFAQATLAKSTLQSYETVWRIFAAWCKENGLESLPAAPTTVASFLCHLVDNKRKTATIEKYLFAISTAHRATGQDYSPADHSLVRTTWAGIRRTLGTTQRGKDPLVIEDIRRICASLPDSLKGVRDRAVILLGYAGAYRRSELVSLDLNNIEQVAEGLVIITGRSKTDQEARGYEKGIPFGQHSETCPVLAVRAWRDRMAAAGITSGPLFRSLRGGKIGGRLPEAEVARIVKAACKAAGLDPSRYAAHSLRSGFATTTGREGAEERHIMEQTGHKSERMVRRYIKKGKLFINNAAAKAGY